ncbi:heat- and acid-stable phosphoprotein [Erysiphe necator]|uniref:Putative casein kinase substrate phosphoprotein pp28 protein n=1 Tax=Uncinula necator TaxID=52586 RepID=A0A0B1P3S3_UNCNE|nr:heat- and acid-stable phosphoprotein [Erysiphe necator]KHJ32938.1 putative casein kinase substrate phosphoprotein pp28 protein [Erysiphe necator]
MAPGGPPGGGRGRGGKFKKYTRGGGKHFSRNLRPLDEDGNEIKRANDEASSSEEEEEDDDNDESSEEEPSETGIGQPKILSREERRIAAKAKKQAAIAKKNESVVEAGDMPSDSENESDEELMTANPNHSKAARNQTRTTSTDIDNAANKVKDLNINRTAKGRTVGELSRREREAIQAQQARERYQKLHEAGKTDEAKADLARLKLVREKREAEAARKQAEKEEREEAEKAKKDEISAREAKRRAAALGSAKTKGSSKK